MTTPTASAWVELGDFTGPQGEDGDQGIPGVSITAVHVDQGTGNLFVDLSNGQTLNAGRVKGEPGGGIDFESSVASPAALPASGAEYGEARYAQSNGHLYVWERSQDRGGNGDGWTDVGPIRGEPGPQGNDGAPGVSVTGTAINGSGHLIVTLSSGSTIDAGVARGQDGAPGNPGATGERGTDVIAYSGSTPPAASGYRVNTIAIGGNGKLLRAV